MRINTRTTYAFVELKVDTIEDTIHKSHENEIHDTVLNLIKVIDDLLNMLDLELTYEINRQ